MHNESRNAPGKGTNRADFRFPYVKLENVSFAKIRDVGHRKGVRRIYGVPTQGTKMVGRGMARRWRLRATNAFPQKKGKECSLSGGRGFNFLPPPPSSAV